MQNTGSYTLLAAKGCGSVIVEAALALAGLPHKVEEIAFAEPGPARDRLLALNPLGQVPTLILPGGEVLTESAAMVLHLADRAPHAGLAPLPDDPARPAFLRWLVFLVSAIYPTFTYGDDPSRHVGGETARAELRAGTDAHGQRCWRIMEDAVSPAPWVLGRRSSALDLYVSAMTRWRPRRAWFAEHCPKLHAVALRVDEDPRVAVVWARNYGLAGSAARPTPPAPCRENSRTERSVSAELEL
jgi:GST-like protein